MVRIKRLFCAVCIVCLLLCGGQAVYATMAVPVGSADVTIGPVLLWERGFSGSWSQHPTSPVLYDGEIYVYAGDSLQVFSARDGALRRSAAVDGRAAFHTIGVTVCERSVFVPLSDGRIICYDRTTLAAKWTYQNALGGQCLTRIEYDGDAVYTGFWNGETDAAEYVCVNARTGVEQWTIRSDGGFYGCSPALTDDYILFGCDNAAYAQDDAAAVICADRRTGEVTDRFTVRGDVRSGVYRDPTTGRYFCVTKAGLLYAFSLSPRGKLDAVPGAPLALGGASVYIGGCYDGLIYLGVQGDSFDNGTILAADTAALAPVFSVPTQGYVQKSILLMPIGDTLTVFFTYNAPPGGISCFSVSGREPSAVRPYFVPAHQGYCLSDLCIDADGDLFFKNDSGYIFAVAPSYTRPNPLYRLLQRYTLILRRLIVLFG